MKTQLISDLLWTNLMYQFPFSPCAKPEIGLSGFFVSIMQSIFIKVLVTSVDFMGDFLKGGFHCSILFSLILLKIHLVFKV